MSESTSARGGGASVSVDPCEHGSAPGHAHAHAHSVASARARHERGRDAGRLVRALLLTGTIAIAELVGGLVSNSLSLLSDAGHMLVDVSALALSLLALFFALRPADPKKTYGYYRAEILSALVNGVVLLGMTGFIVFEALERLSRPEPVRLGPALIVSAVGLVANVVALLVLHPSHSLNVRGAYLHVLGDTLSSVGVLVGLGLMWLTGWTRIDPLISLLIALIIVVGAVRLLRESVDVLLEAVPKHVDLEAVRAILAAVPEVRGVHDLHVWTISSGIYALSAHLVVDEPTVCENDRILTAVKHKLIEEFGIDHTTIQIESSAYAHVGEVH